ncbi:MAG: T9SS type A sorting domain-containing protein [Candidatus Stahlbacteria bacterium]|nr:T9SS type A sorting domain-containing protein [Candidatus Stahlbacteria bacterium]
MSSDSGRGWQEINSPSLAADFTHIICDIDNSLYISGKSNSKIPKGMVYRSKDRGLSWDTLFATSGWLPSRIIALAQSKVGFLFAGGDTNVVLRSGYCSNGWMESSVYDIFQGYPVVNGSLEFGRIHFTANSELVKVKVRSSCILDSMPEWGSYVPNDSNPIYSGSAHNGDRYIQYRVEANSGSQLFTPAMHDICLRYKMDVESPIISSAVAYDGDSIAPGIDIDDYVVIEFNEPTNTPFIETANIDRVLRLSKGHSWRSDAGRGVIKMPGEWITPKALKIYLTTLKMGGGMGYPPTIAEQDTVYPDSMTICDKWGTACISPCMITGKFDIEEREKLEVESVELRVLPNPFIQSTSIKYQVPVKNRVGLKIYDTAGRVVKVLADKENVAGSYTVKVEGIRSGVYFVRLDVGSFVIIQKLICFL